MKKFSLFLLTVFFVYLVWQVMQPLRLISWTNFSKTDIVENWSIFLITGIMLIFALTALITLLRQFNPPPAPIEYLSDSWNSNFNSEHMTCYLTNFIHRETKVPKGRKARKERRARRKNLEMINKLPPLLNDRVYMADIARLENRKEPVQMTIFYTSQR